MTNGKVIMGTLAVLLVAMAAFALFVDSKAPTAAVGYEFGENQLEEIKLCEASGKTPWVLTTSDGKLAPGHHMQPTWTHLDGCDHLKCGYKKVPLMENLDILVREIVNGCC